MIHKNCRARNNGLTLLELLVVIAILGLLTATVTAQLGDTLGPATLQQSISQWEFADQQLRARARHTGKPVALHFEIGGGRLECALGPDEDTPRTIRTLGRGVQITKCLSATQEVNSGSKSIGYDERGSSETFAIEFMGRREKRRWMIVAGITGQITEVANEAAAREVLQLLLPPGIHAS